MKKFPERLHWGGKATFGVWWLHPIGWASGLDDRESWLAVPLSAFLTANTVWAAASGSSCHASPIKIDYTFNLWAKANFPSLSCLFRAFFLWEKLWEQQLCYMFMDICLWYTSALLPVIYQIILIPLITWPLATTASCSPTFPYYIHSFTVLLCMHW